MDNDEVIQRLSPVVDLLNLYGLAQVVGLMNIIILARVENLRNSTDHADQKLFADYMVISQNLHEVARLAGKHNV